jgi:hypothetical protein
VKLACESSSGSGARAADVGNRVYVCSTRIPLVRGPSNLLSRLLTFGVKAATFDLEPVDFDLESVDLDLESVIGTLTSSESSLPSYGDGNVRQHMSTPRGRTTHTSSCHIVTVAKHVPRENRRRIRNRGSGRCRKLRLLALRRFVGQNLHGPRPDSFWTPLDRTLGTLGPLDPL